MAVVAFAKGRYSVKPEDQFACQAGETASDCFVLGYLESMRNVSVALSATRQLPKEREHSLCSASYFGWVRSHRKNTTLCTIPPSSHHTHTMALK